MSTHQYTGTAQAYKAVSNFRYKYSFKSTQLFIL